MDVAGALGMLAVAAALAGLGLLGYAHGETSVVVTGGPARDRPPPAGDHHAHPAGQETQRAPDHRRPPGADLEAAKSFYADYLGLSTEEFNLGWVARYTSPDTGANIQLVTRDAAAPENPAVSVFTDDVDGAYAEALERGYEIVHPLTTEAWGVRRFFVRRRTAP